MHINVSEGWREAPLSINAPEQVCRSTAQLLFLTQQTHPQAGLTRVARESQATSMRKLEKAVSASEQALHDASGTIWIADCPNKSVWS